MKYELLALLESYRRSKIKRVAAAYQDAELREKHLVHQWFNLCPQKPAQYVQEMQRRRFKQKTG